MARVSAPLLDRVVERQVLDGHDGRSGARIERVRLDDGTRLVVKRATPAEDLTVVAGGGVDREAVLWSSGALGRLPAGVGHAIVDVHEDGDATVTVMRDLGDRVPGWSRILSAAECGRILDAMTALHDTFAGDVPTAACPLTTRLGLLAPQTMAPLVGGANPLPGVVMRGWERFFELVASDVADTVAAHHADPAPLAGVLSSRLTTLLHADLWLVNLALDDTEVVFLDWAIATNGPPALDLAIFLAGSAAHIAPTREQLIAKFRRRSRHTDDRTMHLALFAELADLGWNKALDAAEHDDPAMRARESADLDWWVTQARIALDQYA
jgi:Phosphotransferase enzyme family